MSIIDFDPDLQMLTVTVVTDPQLEALCSNSKVLHLFRKGSRASICGRLARTMLGPYYCGGSGLKMCCYCLAECQRGHAR